MKMADNVTFISVNLRGAQLAEKRKDVLNFLKKKKYSIYFLQDFSDFYLTVSASVNDANYRRPNSFITPMTRDMDRNMLPAVKTENFFSPIFLIFIWL